MYRTMPLGPPIASRTLDTPVVPAVITLAVAFEIDPTTDSSKSPTPWKVSLIPGSNALMIWLPPEARDDMVCPNSDPMPARTEPPPVSLKELSWSGMAYKPLYRVVSQLYSGPSCGVPAVPVQVIMQAIASAQHMC